MSPQYMACSVMNDEHRTGGSSTPDLEKDLSNFSVEDDDSFKDALPEFSPTTDQSFYLHNFDMARNLMHSPADSCEVDAIVGQSDLLRHDRDEVKRKCDIFYEARDNTVNDFVSLTFLTRRPDSHLYDNIDMQVIGEFIIFSIQKFFFPYMIIYSVGNC